MEHNCSTELEIDTPTWPFLAPQATDATGKEGFNVLADVIDPNN